MAISKYINDLFSSSVILYLQVLLIASIMVNLLSISFITVKILLTFQVSNKLESLSISSADNLQI